MKLTRRLVAPYHQDSPIPLWLLLGLLLISVSTLLRLANQPITADDPADFRPIFVGQKVLATGGDPYNDRLIKETWSNIVDGEGLESATEPGRPEFPLLYPPWALPVFTVFATAPWLSARGIWWAAISAFLLGIVWMVARASSANNRFVPFVDILLIALAFRATDWALFVGQPMLLCLVLGFASWHLDRSGNPILSGIALGLAAFKVTLVVPFAVMMIYRRQWTVLAVAALTGLALTSAFFVLLEDEPLTSVENFRFSMASMAYSPDEPSQQTVYSREIYITMKTQLAALVEGVIPGAGSYAAVVNVLPSLLVLPFWVIPLFQKRISDVRVFLVFGVLTLLSTYHLHYDALVLLPLYLLARKADLMERTALLIIGGFFLLPLNGLVGRLNLPDSLGVLFFNVQFGLMGLAVVLTWGMRRTLAGSEP